MPPKPRAQTSDPDFNKVLGRIQQMQTDFDEGRRKVKKATLRLKKL